MSQSVVRLATPTDRPHLRRAVVELQEYERRLSATRLPGETIADASVAWLEREAANSGAILVAEMGGAFAGFAAGWVVAEDNIAESADSRRFGFVSDICVMPPFRGQRIAGVLLAALERHLAAAGITRVRLGALAGNAAAQTAYRRAGYEPYEIVFEKRIRA